MIRLFHPVGLCPVTFYMFVNLFFFFVVIIVFNVVKYIVYIKKKSHGILGSTSHKMGIRMGVINILLLSAKMLKREK